ncbi:MAG TPA: adenosylcobinamide-GDP ribazoletransferase [Acidimicrobiales bacterium]
MVGTAGTAVRVMPGLRGALGFLTAVGGAAVPDRRSVVWFGPVGALVGLLVGLVWRGAGELWPPLVAALLTVVADAALTGMLHYDGLADTADGLLPPLDRTRRLAVLSDPQAGAFAVVVVPLVLGLQVAAFASMAPDPWLVVGLWAAARAAMGVTLATVPYARARAAGSDGGAGGAASTAGLASAFVGTSPWPSVVVGAAALAVAGVAQGWPGGPTAAAALVAGFGGVMALAHRRLGGFTGDVLGAAGVVGQTCALVVAAARW